ncbi:MAG TPA: RNA pseudouridine synthase [Opitutaceae bacterium]|nr:RNA pseudouridine synthase [Opitutaceae bacterium]HND60407.1 RNA pseudouridine synthase [Opitutaceae bacterium]
MSAAAESFWSTLPLGRGVTLLTHDANGLAAFDKPAGVLSHPNAGGDEPRSLLTVRYHLDGEYYEWTPAPGAAPQRLWLLNRLDSATSGVILVAAEAELAQTVRAHFKRRQVHKTYHALVFGGPRQASEHWKDVIATTRQGAQVRSVAGVGRVPAECRMTLVRRGTGAVRVSLLKLEPQTGRSHQLRVQCAKRHLPIVGDQTYGDFPANRAFAKEHRTKRLFLHSLSTRFEYEFRGRKFSFAAEAPLPEEFATGL